MQREQAFKVEMVATVEGFDGDRAFVGNHWPVEISCHVIVNSVIVLQELFLHYTRHCTRMRV